MLFYFFLSPGPVQSLCTGIVAPVLVICLNSPYVKESDVMAYLFWDTCFGWSYSPASSLLPFETLDSFYGMPTFSMPLSSAMWNAGDSSRGGTN